MFDFASYHRATTLADAITLLADNPQAKLLAGGTDVLIQLHHHNDRYRHIVDIHNLAELRGITQAEDGALRIGSATTFTQLIEDPVIQRNLPALCAAAASIAGPQIRNVATYGGNICNGATSGRLYRKYAQPLTGLEAVVLPSTSPANAAFTMPRLLDAWGTALEGYVNKP